MRIEHIAMYVNDYESCVIGIEGNQIEITV